MSDTPHTPAMPAPPVTEATPAPPVTAVTPAPPVTPGGEDASADALSPPLVAERGTGSMVEGDPVVLEAEIVAAASGLHRARHRLITALAAFDATGAWAFTGAHSCARWVADRLGVHTGTAREWLRVGHALARLRLIDAAMAAGRLSYCAVRALTRVAVDHPDHQAELVALAERCRAGELAGVLARGALGHDRDDQRDERERDATWFSARVEPDGMGTICVRLPVIDMGRIQAAVDARVMQTPPRDPARPHPPLGYQRARALLELLGCAPANTPAASSPAPSSPAASSPAVGTSGTVRVATEVIVHVRSDGTSLHDGSPIAESSVASLLDEAFIRLMIHDARNRPVNASVRRRHPTVRQKRVVDERHPVCVDCGATELLEYDHDPAHAITGRTHTDELARRCPHCHRRRHANHPVPPHNNSPAGSHSPRSGPSRASHPDGIDESRGSRTDGNGESRGSGAGRGGSGGCGGDPGPPGEGM